MSMPSASRPIVIGARGSPLSVRQTALTRAALLERLGGAPDTLDAVLPFVAISTTGDRIQDRTLSDIGGKGLFTKELDEALLDGRIDAAVHSMKDLPTALPDGIVLAATPQREDPRDGFVSVASDSLESLPAGAIVGTASLRRQAQTLYARPDLTVTPLRGNVDTRLRRLTEGVAHATYLAASGLTRLGLLDRVTAFMDPEAAPPAACQGALAITARAGDARVLEALALLHHTPTGITVAAERAFLTALDGSCRTPIAAIATLQDDGRALRLLAEALTPDGRTRWRRDETIALGDAPKHAAADLGARLGADIRAQAGDALFAPS